MPRSLSDAASRRAAYTAFSLEHELPAFARPFWLDAVVGSTGWDAVTVFHAEQPVAMLAFALEKKWWGRRIYMPFFTQWCYLWLAESPSDKYVTRLSYQMELLTEVAAALPQVDYLHLNLFYNVDNWLPFYHKGYRQSVRYSYVIEDLSDLEVVFQGMKREVRTRIRQTQKQFEVTEQGEPSVFWHILERTLNKTSYRLPWTAAKFLAFDRALADRNCREILAAKDESGQVQGVAYVVWDDKRLDVLFTALAPELHPNKAGYLLNWEAMRMAARLGVKEVDLVGSMLPNVEPSRRALGGRLRPFYQLTKVSNPLLRTYFALRNRPI